MKRLHLFVLKSFLPLFAMTFFIVLFIVLMQFLWRYIDDLVGKGLSMGIIGELFFYAAVSMVPMALPLAILLASLMTFGNLGERFELTAMKAAGISLVRVMAPLIVLIGGIAVGAFFFQNDVLPKAQVKMWTLLFSMRQKSPEVEIPVGVFYDQIPGINLYVGEKNQNTGMLYDVKIYDVRHGGDNVTILVSDSAKMALTEDMKYIYLYMYRGNQYEKMTANSSMPNNPFRRESFETKEILIPFDNNFNRLDEGGMKNQYVGKNISELRHTMDSLTVRIDSLGAVNAQLIARQNFPMAEKTMEGTGGAYRGRATSRQVRENNEADAGIRREGVNAPGGSQAAAKKAPEKIAVISFDSLMQTLNPTAERALIASAIRDANYKRNAIQFESESISLEKKTMRRHGIELLKKFTLSVACIIFFFIGAPLGAIIRKGGLGTPLVISVLLFLVYYIIDNTGYKMARDGHAAIWLGMWLSTFILAPLGLFVTYKAMNDSAVFDPDRIKMFFRRLFNRRETRSIALKEVVINDMEPEVILYYLVGIDSASGKLLEQLAHRRLFVGRKISKELHQFAENLDLMIDYLHDTKDPKIIDLLNSYPVIQTGRFTFARTIRKDLKEVERIDRILLGAGGFAYLEENKVPEHNDHPDDTETSDNIEEQDQISSLELPES